MDDIVTDVVKGVVYGSLEWIKDQAKKYAEDHKKGNIKIVTDKETFKVIKEQKKLPELHLFTKYITDPVLCQLYHAGVALRYFETNVEKRDELRTKIRNMYGVKGLRIAEFIQNGYFMKYLTVVMAREKTENAIKKDLKLFFENFDKHVTVVQETDKNEKNAREIVMRINSNLPRTYIIFGSGKAAKKSSDIKKIVLAEISNYVVEEYVYVMKRAYFFNKEE